MDHPRSRGVYVSVVSSSVSPVGSSPLARGLPVAPKSVPAGNRIIPARAGFTYGGLGRSQVPGDHPRSRGVYPSADNKVTFFNGSSPLARGLRPRAPPLAEPRRIIPARAGFTLGAPARLDLLRDHPRSRGVYYHEIAHETADQGSSPLARGLRQAANVFARLPRIIPARAGFTPHCQSSSSMKEDHPRSRGVYLCVSSSPVLAVGSSPLARGLHMRLEKGIVADRIIPARAGFTVTWSR